MMEPLQRAARSATQPEARTPRADAWELPSAQAVERSWLDRHRVIVYFLVALLAIDLGVARHRDLWNVYSPDDYVERLEGCLNTAPDVVLVGGSTVSEGIDPAALAGLRWRGQPLQRPYNLGLPGATTSEVWHAVEHGLRTPPRLMVYGLTASDWNDARQEPHGPSALMNASDVATWVAARPDSAEWVIRHFLQDHIARLWNLFYYRNGIRLWAIATADSIWPDLFPTAAAEARENVAHAGALRRPGGFAPRLGFQQGRLDHVKAAGALPSSFPFLENYRITDGHLSYLQRLLDWAEQQHVDVVLVDMPVSADLEERMYPNAFASYRQTLAEVARQHHLSVLAAPRATVGVSDADFADLVHLNVSGVARMSTWLRQTLEGMP